MVNPLLVPSPHDCELPSFPDITPAHLEEALRSGMAQQSAAVQQILDSSEDPTFANTAAPMEHSGAQLSLAQAVLSTFASSVSSPQIRELESTMAPELAAHHDSIWMSPRLHARYRGIDTSELDEEDTTLVATTLRDLEAAGAHLEEEARSSLASLNKELAAASTEFRARALAATEAAAVAFSSEADLEGLDEATLASAAQNAKDRGVDGTWVLPLVAPTPQPSLASMQVRDARRRLHRAAISRGQEGEPISTAELVRRIVTLRAQRAALLGHPHHASAVLAREGAGSVASVRAMLAPVIRAARRHVAQERAVLLERTQRNDPPHTLEAWDWAQAQTAELRSRSGVDPERLRSWLEWGSVLHNGVFHVAQKLYGLTFTERPELPAHHVDATVFEVRDEHRSLVGLLVVDPWARAGKKGGAWVNHIVQQSSEWGTQPVVGLTLNIPKPPEGQPALLRMREVTTAFHEAGHAVHALLSQCRWASLSGTSVARDFVEFPSQFNEMWATWPEVLKNYAKHHATGEPLPDEAMSALTGDDAGMRGEETFSYLAAVALDLACHTVVGNHDLGDLEAFEREVLQEWGLWADDIPPRYRLTYFSHVFGGGYDARYYSYIWSEVLAADAKAWFRQQGLTREAGERLRAEVLSRGASRDVMESWRAFRGNDPDPSHLLADRGMAEGEDTE